MSDEKCRCGHDNDQHDWAYDQCCSGGGPTKYGCGCGGFSTEPAPTIDEVRASLTADVTREPTGGQGLREALQRWLSGRVGGMCWDEAPWQEWGDEADELLTLPALAALIADAERVRRVRAVPEEVSVPGCISLDRLRRALDGEPQP